MSGPVLPNGLFKQGGKEFSAGEKQFRNFSFKQGIVTRIREKDDQDNQGKFCTEYDVLVFEQNGNGGVAPVTYKNVMAFDVFGGIADFYRFKLRKHENENIKDLTKNTGSVVLMLCLNGNSDMGVIVGCLQHGGSKNRLSKEDGQALEWEYNGINFGINDDGSFRIVQRGPTDNLGDQKGEGGTQIRLEKDGSFEINDSAGGKRDPETGAIMPMEEKEVERIRMDKTQKSVSFEAGKSINALSRGTYSVDAKEDITIKTAAKMALEAAGSASMTCEALKVTAKNDVEITAKGMTASLQANFKLEAKQIKMSAPQIVLDGIVQVGGPGGQPALITSTTFFGIGNLGIPVFSIAQGPYSSKVMIKP